MTVEVTFALTRFGKSFGSNIGFSDITFYTFPAAV